MVPDDLLPTSPRSDGITSVYPATTSGPRQIRRTVPAATRGSFYVPAPGRLAYDLNRSSGDPSYGKVVPSGMTGVNQHGYDLTVTCFSHLTPLGKGSCCFARLG